MKIEGKEEWNLNPSMRLKVKGDMFFLPEPDGGVYFRNNVGSFRMQGNSIGQWIEKLIPMFNGEHTMEQLTEGLPVPYKERVYEIAEVLYLNGYVRDISGDHPHQLEDRIFRRYENQIEFLDSFGGSGAYRFQLYREKKVLAIGSGSFLVSLIKSLLESGMPKFQFIATGVEETNRTRITEIVQHARKTDSSIELKEISMPDHDVRAWREVIQPFDSILYVSQECGGMDWRLIHTISKEENKILLPAMFMEQTGVAGPLIHPASDACWESARRRLHFSAISRDSELHARSSTSEALLANVIVFEWFKTAAEATVSELENRLYLLDLETLEGSWHFFLPHPLVNGSLSFYQVEDLERLLETAPHKESADGLIPYFNGLTARETGIFHVWEEGDLKQLPLAQCRIQVVDPISEGPAELMPEMICNGLNHIEARREAGLIGVEAYVSRLHGLSDSLAYIGVGAGETIAEGICRGLQKCLNEELRMELADGGPVVHSVRLISVDDEPCSFYLTALTAMQGAPMIGIGREVDGFPAIWVGINEKWYGGAGMNVTMALRSALQQALLHAQNKADLLNQRSVFLSVRIKEEASRDISISSCKNQDHREVLQSAKQILHENHKRLLVYDLTSESFLRQELAGVFGVSLREEMLE